MKKRTIIVDAVRSPMGMKNGKMIGIRPDDLGAKTLKVLLERNSSISPEKIEDVVVGCAFPRFARYAYGKGCFYSGKYS